MSLRGALLHFATKQSPRTWGLLRAMPSQRHLSGAYEEADRKLEKLK